MQITIPLYIYNVETRGESAHPRMTLVGTATKQSAYQNIVTTTEISVIIVAIALVLPVLMSRPWQRKKQGNLVFDMYDLRLPA